MMRSLWSGVTGLQAHQIAMDVEGNNIANVNTNGFKYSRANFEDLIYQNSRIATAPQNKHGGVNGMQVGLGTQVQSTTKIFKQGSLQTTDKQTDIALQGDGFFMVSPDGGKTYYYTRNGDFSRDSEGNFVDNNGLIAQGWMRDEDTGKIDPTRPIENINIPRGLTTPAKTTTEVSLVANLDSGNDVGTKKIPSYRLDQYNKWVEKDNNGIKSENEKHEENNIGDNQFYVNRNNEQRLKERGVDLGVLFNSNGDAYNLRDGQGIWASYADAKTNALDVGADVNGNFATAKTVNMVLNGETIRASGITSVSQLAAVIREKYAKTGVEATVTDGNKLVLTNRNNTGTTANSKNIKLTMNTPLGDLDSMDVITAYQYTYSKTRVETTHTYDDSQARQVTTTEDLREAMQKDARLFTNYTSKIIANGSAQRAVNTATANLAAAQAAAATGGPLETAVTTAQNAVTTAQGLIPPAQAALNTAQTDLNTARGILTTATNNLATAQTALAAAEATLRTAQAAAAADPTNTALQAAVTAAQNDVNTKQNDVNTKQNSFNTAQNNFNTKKSDYDLKAADLETKKRSLEIARTNLKRAQAALVSGRAAIPEAQAALDKANAVLTATTPVIAAKTALDTARAALELDPTNPTLQTAYNTAKAAYVAAYETALKKNDKNDGVEVTVNELGQFKVANPRGDAINSDDGDLTDGTIDPMTGTPRTTNPTLDTQDDDHDINMTITGLTNSSSGITENTKFTASLSPLNGSLNSGDATRVSDGTYVAAHSSSTDIYDSLGTKHNVKMDFAKRGYTANGGTEWSVIIQVAEPNVINTENNGLPSNVVVGYVRFNPDGSLATYSPASITFAAQNGSAGGQTIRLNFGQTGTMTGLTSADDDSSTKDISQNGYASGDLTGVRIDQSGTIIGSFSNGKSLGLAQVAVAKFANNAGLSAEGGNLFGMTANSGEPIIGTAATAGRGSITASSLEMSNVDLSRSLTQLIVVQRGFQANSKTITTSDEMLNTLLQLK